MDSTNEFDHWLERPGVRRQTFIVDAMVESRDLTFIVDAMVESRDTLQGCWKAASSVFGEQARPEHALMLLPIALARADAARQAARQSLASRTDDEA